MSGIIDVIARPMGVDDISWGQNSFVYVDVNGVPQRVNQVNAGDMPFETYADAVVQNLVDGSKNLPLGASNLGVVNTSIFSGPVYGSGTTSGYVKNYASGLLQYGQGIATADIPSGIPASNIGSGTVNDAEFGYLDGLTSPITAQIGILSAALAGLGGVNYFQPGTRLKVLYTGAATAIVRAQASSPAMVPMNGYPDILNPGLWVSGGLSNGNYYQVTSDTALTLPANLWGSEKASQWYAVLANCATATAQLGAYVLKGMPYLRCKSEASQVISCGTNLSPSAAIDYGFTANEFVGGKIYVLSGPSAGAIRTISANNSAAGSTTITYTGAVLNLIDPDWFIIMPPGLNFRWIGDVFNDGSSNLVKDLCCPWLTLEGRFIFTSNNVIIANTRQIRATVVAGGGGGTALAAQAGEDGGMQILTPYSLTIGTSYACVVGAEGGLGLAGGSSYIRNTATTIVFCTGGTGLGAGSGLTNTLVAVFLDYSWGKGGSPGDLRPSYPGVIIIDG